MLDLGLIPRDPHLIITSSLKPELNVACKNETSGDAITTTTKSASSSTEAKPILRKQSASPDSGRGISSGSRMALCIGNEKYKKLDKLMNARNDSIIFGTILKENFEDSVTHKNNIANVKAYNDVITEFVESLSEGDTVVFFYAGHACETEHGNALLPINATSTTQSASSASSSERPVTLQYIQRPIARGKHTVIGTRFFY